MSTTIGKDLSVGGATALAGTLGATGKAALVDPSSTIGGQRILSTADLGDLHGAPTVGAAIDSALANANSSTALAQFALNQANTANSIAIAAYNQANAATTLANNIFLVANSAANTVATYANGSVVLVNANLNFNNTSTINVSAVANGTTQANISFNINTSSLWSSDIGFTGNLTFNNNQVKIVSSNNNFNPLAFFANGQSSTNRGWTFRIGTSADLQLRTTDDTGTPQVGGTVIDIGRNGNNVTTINIGDSTSNPVHNFFGNVTITPSANIGNTLTLTSDSSNVALVVNDSGSAQPYVYLNSTFATGGFLGFYQSNTRIGLVGSAKRVGTGALNDFGIGSSSAGQNVTISIGGVNCLIANTGNVLVPNSVTTNTQTRVFTGLSIFTSANTSRTSTAALANEANLTVTINETGVYVFETLLMSTSNAANGGGGIQWDYGGGSATVAAFKAAWFGTAGGAIGGSSIHTSATGAFAVTAVGASNLIDSIIVKGIVTFSAVGTFILRYAQNSSNAAPTILTANSYMILTKVG